MCSSRLVFFYHVPLIKLRKKEKAFFYLNLFLDFAFLLLVVLFAKELDEILCFVQPSSNSFHQVSHLFNLALGISKLGYENIRNFSIKLVFMFKP